MTRLVSVIAVLLTVYALWVLGMLAAAMRRSARWRKKAADSAVLAPKIHDALIHYLAGSENRALLADFAAKAREDMADAILAFRGTVAGGARDRLCELTLELALLHEWCQDARAKDITVRRAAFHRLAFVAANEPCWRVAGDPLMNAMADPDLEIRFSAAHGVAQGGSAEEVVKVFELALAENLLFRILLLEDLRRHAEALCQTALPEALHSDDARRVLAALQIAVAWERALPIEGIDELLARPEKEIRILALRLTALVSTGAAARELIGKALGDADRDVALAAVRSAGRLRMESAIPELSRVLRGDSPQLYRAAAAALALIPPQGWEMLKELSANLAPATAMAAAEALVQVRKAAV